MSCHVVFFAIRTISVRGATNITYCYYLVVLRMLLL